MASDVHWKNARILLSVLQTESSELDCRWQQKVFLVTQYHHSPFVLFLPIGWWNTGVCLIKLKMRLERSWKYRDAWLAFKWHHPLPVCAVWCSNPSGRSCFISVSACVQALFLCLYKLLWFLWSLILAFKTWLVSYSMNLFSPLKSSKLVIDLQLCWLAYSFDALHA